MLIDRTRQGQVVPIDEAAAGLGVPKRLREIIARAVHPEPDMRHPTVIDLQDELQAFLRGGLHLPSRLFGPGELIIAEGDMGECAYMITEGQCRAFRMVGGRKETLAMMSAGDVFGEMALLLKEPRAASVEAVDRVAVLVLDKATLDAGLGVDGWTGSLLRALAQRFRDLEQIVRDAGLRRSE